MPHDTFDIPAQVIAEERAKYYAGVDSKDGLMTFDEAYKRELQYTLGDDSELLDWAGNNTNWTDVEKYAVKVEVPEILPDLNRSWLTASRKVISK